MSKSKKVRQTGQIVSARPDIVEKTKAALARGRQFIANRKILAERREVQRRNYARYRELGHKIAQKGVVKWSTEHHGYIASFLSQRRPAERQLAIKLFELQKELIGQALLILELEFAIDREKKEGQ